MNVVGWPVVLLLREGPSGVSSQAFHVPPNPQSSRKRLYPGLFLTVKTAATSSLPDLTWPKDSQWAVWGLMAFTEAWPLQGDAWAVFSTQWPFGEEPLTGSSGAQSHYTPYGLFLPCSGWIAALSILKQDLAVSIIMMVVAGFFTLCAVLSLFLLKRVSGGCWASCKPKEAGTSLLPSPWGCSPLQQLGLLGPQRSSSFLQGSGWEVRQAGVCGGSLGNITWMTWFLVAHRAGLLSPQPLSAGALPVPPDGGQLPAGPRGVFPGHLQ